jgi:hypothetical protein
LPVPLKVHLSEEDQELLEFQKIGGIPLKVRETAEIIRLNHHGWTVAAIAKSKQKSSGRKEHYLFIGYFYPRKGAVISTSN